jgi:hypothetical protein
MNSEGIAKPVPETCKKGKDSIKQDEQRSFLKHSEARLPPISRVNINDVLAKKGTSLKDIKITRRKKRVKTLQEQLAEHVRLLTDEMMDREPWKQSRTFKIINKKS